MEEDFVPFGLDSQVEYEKFHQYIDTKQVTVCKDEEEFQTRVDFICEYIALLKERKTGIEQLLEELSDYQIANIKYHNDHKLNELSQRTEELMNEVTMKTEALTMIETQLEKEKEEKLNLNDKQQKEMIEFFKFVTNMEAFKSFNTNIQNNFISETPNITINTTSDQINENQDKQTPQLIDDMNTIEEINERVNNSPQKEIIDNNQQDFFEEDDAERHKERVNIYKEKMDFLDISMNPENHYLRSIYSTNNTNNLSTNDNNTYILTTHKRKYNKKINDKNQEKKPSKEFQNQTKFHSAVLSNAKAPIIESSVKPPDPALFFNQSKPKDTVDLIDDS